MFWILLGPAVRNPAACIKEESISRLSVRKGGSTDISSSFRGACLSSPVRWCRSLVLPPQHETRYLSSQPVSLHPSQVFRLLEVRLFLPSFQIGFEELCFLWQEQGTGRILQSVRQPVTEELGQVGWPLNSWKALHEN